MKTEIVVIEKCIRKIQENYQRNWRPQTSSAPYSVEYFKHVRSHNEGNRYGRNPQDRPCPYCGKVLKPPSFANHKRECQRRQESNYIQCGLCEYKAVSKPALSQHVSRIHGGPKNFICKEQVSRNEGVGVCGQGFLRQCDMDKHIRSKHLSNPVQCDVCGSTSRNEYALYNHKRVRHNAAIKEHNNALKRIRKERMRIKNETVPQHQGVKTITPFGTSQWKGKLDWTCQLLKALTVSWSRTLHWKNVCKL